MEVKNPNEESLGFSREEPLSPPIEEEGQFEENSESILEQEKEVTGSEPVSADVAAETIASPGTEPQVKTIQLNLSPLVILIVGLALGFVAGFVGRPYLLSRSQLALFANSAGEEPASRAALPQDTQNGPAGQEDIPASATAVPASAENPSTAETTTATEDSAARQDAARRVMELLASRTRHFKGSPDAPVTMIEFSDFQ